MRILAIETSCDETAAAVVEDGVKILSNVVASSAEIHQKYGGVVPELAAREQLRSMIPVLTEALTPLYPRPGLEKSGKSSYLNTMINLEIDALAVTVGPGLIGSLLVGVETAKTIAFVTGKPIIPVNHVLAHVYANFIENGYMATWSHGSKESIQPSNHPTMSFPAMSLVVSGGHTELYLMKSMKDLKWLGGTLDDAAGEAFDKTARLLGFGTGGGLAIEEAAKKLQSRYNTPQPPLNLRGGEGGVILPRPMIKDDSLNFSFSGLKTAIIRELQALSKHYDNIYYHSDRHSFELPEDITAAFAYEVQEAITDVLVEKTLRAAKMYHAKSILLSGGVASNQRLRVKFFTKLRSNELTKLTFHAPSPALCTDNAVYIASYAFFRGKSTDWHKVAAIPDLTVE